MNKIQAHEATDQNDTVTKPVTVLESHGYTIGEDIGQGSYATVKMAQSAQHNGTVAVKVISKFSAPQDYLQKFLPREIEVVKGLKHPNLIRFLQAIETTHRVYIIMEFAENGSLLDLIRKENYIDEARARRWFTQLVDVVSYCHGKGVVHRDIKCENLLLATRSMNLKLSDFGFARASIYRQGQPVLSETFCGSYAYAAPEILRGIPYYPIATDVWSMGVVLFAMLYGRLPFDDSSFPVLIKQVSGKVKFPSQPNVSSAAKNLIAKILTPLRMRVDVDAICRDPWFLERSQLPRTSNDVDRDPDYNVRPSLISNMDPLLKKLESFKRRSRSHTRPRI